MHDGATVAGRRALVALACACALAACGGPGDGDGGTDAGGDAGVRRVRAGSVVVEQEAIEPDPPRAVAVASFLDGAAEARCSGRREGACTVQFCEAPPTGGRDGPVARSAGTVTVSGGAGAPAVLAPDADRQYVAAVERALRWRGGDTVSVVAAGADVPAFRGSVAFPAGVRVTAPVAAADTGLALVRRAAPLRVAWQAAGAGRVHARVVQGLGESGAALVIACVFDAAAGEGAVPAAALADLVRTTDASPPTDLLVETRAEATVAAGGWQVEIEATHRAAYTALEVQ